MSSKAITARLKSFPPDQSKVLLKVRDEISTLLPGDTEVIKYGIPTWTIEGIGVIGIDGFKTITVSFLMAETLAQSLKRRYLNTRRQRVQSILILRKSFQKLFCVR